MHVNTPIPLRELQRIRFSHSYTSISTSTLVRPPGGVDKSPQKKTLNLELFLELFLELYPLTYTSILDP
jgi:hypothetical protein